LEAVIQLVPIQVVNVLFRRKPAIKMLFHHPSMLADPPAHPIFPHAPFHVALGIDPPILAFSIDPPDLFNLDRFHPWSGFAVPVQW
jgi:hypothetical protein